MNIEKDLNSKSIEFNMITNGVLFSENDIEFFSKILSGITWSVDGCQRIHDKNRKTKSNKPTYDEIMKNIMKFNDFCEKSCIKPSRAVEATVTNEYFNGDMVKNISDSFSSFFITKCDKVELIPVAGEFLASEDQMRMFSQNLLNYYEKKIIENDKRIPFKLGLFNEYFKKILKGKTKYEIACTAGTSYFAIDGLGDIYSCQVSRYEDKVKLGNIYNDDLFFYTEIASPYITKETFSFCNTCVLKKCCNCFCKVMMTAAEKNNEIPTICKFHEIFFKELLKRVMNWKESGNLRKIISYTISGDNNGNVGV